LVDLTKYEALLDDLNIIEKQIAVLSSKNKDTLRRNLELEEELSEVKREKALMSEKISALETELERIKLENEHITGKSVLSIQDAELLKSRVRDLIEKLDFHLSS
jgi:chromosome segregation ATPase